MSVGGGLLVNGVQQIKHFLYAVWTKVKVFAHKLGKPCGFHASGAKSFYQDRSRLSNANGIGNLDLTTIGQPGSDNILCDVSAGIGGGPVDLGWIFAGECTTTVGSSGGRSAAPMACSAAIGIHDDFAPGKSAISHWTTDDKLSSRVNMVLGVFVQPTRSAEYRLYDGIHDRFL